MSKIVIPKVTIINPAKPRDITPEEFTFIDNSKVSYTENNTGSDAINNNGDVPSNGYAAKLEINDEEINQELPDIVPTSGPGFGSLENILNQTLTDANQGKWREVPSNSNGNPKIVETYKVCNRKYNGDQVPWCAGFVSLMLYKAGISGLKSLASQDYRRYGTGIDFTDWRNVRKNDIVVFSYGGGKGHVGFYRGYDPKNDRVKILGGNQKNSVNISNFKPFKITAVKRNWAVPPEFDVPLYVDANGRSIEFDDTR